jgi:glycosyltransferase involved in cell wall biosynthesis
VKLLIIGVGNVQVMKLATYVSTWPIYNFRYRKLLLELAQRLHLFILTSSPVSGGKINSIKSIFPFKRPKRLWYYLTPFFSQIALNSINADVVWLFDVAGFISPSLTRAPIILDYDDPKIALPAMELKRIPKISLVNELRLLRNRKVRKVVVPTEMIKRKFIALGLDEERIVVIPTGVDTSLFHPTPLPKEPVVLYYGTFQLHRTQLLLEVIDVLVRRRQDVRFLLAGDVPPTVRERLLRVAGNRVEMLGFVEHDLLPQYIQKARVCILPQDRSLGGRLSIKLLEYMASGRPVVSTNVDESFPLKESGAGLITEIEPESFADAVIRLLENDALANHLAWKGVEYAQKYDWNKMVEDYIKLFQQVCNES